jgi:hypothetical protein
VGAIAREETTEVSVGGAQHALGSFDCLRCDWAKKYGFVAAEGPGLMGQTTDIAPPEGPISVQQIVDAMAQKDPVQRHWTCIVERCLQACQRRLGIGASHPFARGVWDGRGKRCKGADSP